MNIQTNTFQRLRMTLFAVTVLTPELISPQKLLPKEPPKDFKTIEGYMEKELKEMYQEPLCGGWSDESVEGKIARVTGVPGREGKWNGNIESGVSWRIEEGHTAGDGLLFPDDTWGLATACRPNSEDWWAIEPNSRRHPTFFCEHPCERPLGNITPANANVQCGDKLEEVRYSCGGSAETKEARIDGGLCRDLNTRWLYALYWNEDTGEFRKGRCLAPRDASGAESDEAKREHERQMNAGGWKPITFGDLKTIAVDNGGTEDALQKFFLNSKEESFRPNDTEVLWHFCCTDLPVPMRKAEIGQAAQLGAGAGANCRSCTGEGKPGDPKQEMVNINEMGCRFPSGVTGTAEKTDEAWKDPNPYNFTPQNDGLIRGVGKKLSHSSFISYFRHYTAGYERDPLTGANLENEATSKATIPVACYGTWEKPQKDAGGITVKEYDPKETVVDPRWKSCVIAPYSTQPDSSFADLGGRQLGEGKTEADLEDLPHLLRNPQFDKEKDLWYQNLGGAMSLLNRESPAATSLTFALLNTDTAAQKATHQVTEENPLSAGSFLRAFDDTVKNETGDRRVIVEWWHELETEMQTFFDPPVVRILLPALWSVGLDPLDPLLTPVEPPEESRSRLTAPIEIQVKAGEDVLGEVAAYLQHSLLLRVTEAPVPVLVPLGDPIEIRAHAARLKSAITMHEDVFDSKTKLDVGATEAIIEKLEGYADQIEDVRKLRAELAQYAGDILREQRTISQAIGTWLGKNMEQYATFQKRKDEIFAQQGAWLQVLALFHQFHDHINFPYCKNDRFTTAIFSLLDPWLLDRLRNPAGALPRVKVAHLPDVILDFSALHRSPGGVELPVLKPIQVRLNLTNLRPVYEGDEPPDLPDLPPVPSIYELVADSLPAVTIEDEDTIPTITTYIPVPERTEFPFKDIAKVLTSMSAEYKKFWDSMLHPLCSDTKAVENVCQGMSADEAARKRCCITEPSDRSKRQPPTREDCLAPYDDPTCVHSEADLHERLERSGARPLVFLEEDFDSIGTPRELPKDGWQTCPPKDWACLLLNREDTYPREGWHIDTVNVAEIADELRRQMIEDTLLPEQGSEESYELYAVPRDRITPSFNVPEPGSLLPESLIPKTQP